MNTTHYQIWGIRGGVPVLLSTYESGVDFARQQLNDPCTRSGDDWFWKGQLVDSPYVWMVEVEMPEYVAESLMKLWEEKNK
jgi:hypothetical protein